VAQGKTSGAVVEALAAWEPPVDWYGLAPRTDDKTVAAEAVGERLAEVVAETVGSHPPVEVRRTVTQGIPASVLVHAARDAQLLVVGNRGHGGFSEALLGSVSLRCARSTPRPRSWSSAPPNDSVWQFAGGFSRVRLSTRQSGTHGFAPAFPRCLAGWILAVRGRLMVTMTAMSGAVERQFAKGT
jgi:hypothetical protein